MTGGTGDLQANPCWVASPALGAGAASAQTGPHAIFETLSVDKFAGLVPPHSVTSPSGAWVWYCDYERDSGRRIRKGDRMSMGVVLTGRGFTHETPVALRVWGHAHVYQMPAISLAASAGPAAITVFAGPGASCAGKLQPACALALSNVKVGAQGDVAANGEKIGKVELQ